MKVSVWYHLDGIIRTSFLSISHFWIPPHGLPSWSATWLQLFEPYTFTALCLFSEWSCKICESPSDWTDLDHMSNFESLWCEEIMCTNWLWLGHSSPGSLCTFYYCAFAFFQFPSVTEPLYMLFPPGKANLPTLPDVVYLILWLSVQALLLTSSHFLYRLSWNCNSLWQYFLFAILYHLINFFLSLTGL